MTRSAIPFAAAAGLAAMLALSACATRPAPDGQFLPGSNVKPVLASPPGSMMTPHGY